MVGPRDVLEEPAASGSVQGRQKFVLPIRCVDHAGGPLGPPPASKPEHAIHVAAKHRLPAEVLRYSRDRAVLAAPCP
jgi:hypothetical protein